MKLIQSYLSIIISIIILVIISILTPRWVGAFYESVEDYQSILSDLTLQPQEAVPPQTAKVVIILIGGLGYNSTQTLNLPVFEQLSQIGANAVIQGSAPSYSQITQMTLVSGALPEINGTAPIDKPENKLSVTTLDTIFARAHEAQQKTAMLGPAYWRRLIPGNQLAETFFINASGAEVDQAIVETALPLLKNNNFDLVFIHLTQLDFAAQYQGGPSSKAYQQAASQIDNLLYHLNQAVDGSNTILMILGDHGYTAAGGYGGNELEIIQQPLVMVGEHIAPGNYSKVYQTDLAPTLTTILGTPPPTAAQGRIWFEMLRLNKQNETRAQIPPSQQK